MTTEPDPAAERVKARKARKQAKRQPLRVATRAGGFAAAAKMFLDGRTQSALSASSVSEECPDCLRMAKSRQSAIQAA